MLQGQSDITLHYCNEASNALQMALDTHPTVILQDLIMPEIDGMTLVRYYRTTPELKEVPLIVLSSKEEPIVKAEAFANGANDYLVKLPDRIELIARIRYHSLGYIRLLERNRAYKQLEESQAALHAELSEAASYVTSLLPKTLKGEITTAWRFIPSEQLGGDTFGYHWIDSDRFAYYLLDVCGHGVGAALLSISVINVLRSQSLHVDYSKPDQVLAGLNHTFPMEDHNNMFFTICYGVYNKKTGQMVIANGGHPPPVLIHSDPSGKKVVQLLESAGGPVIGAMPDMQFPTLTCQVEKGDKLYIYSDGIYELTRADKTVLQMKEFLKVLGDPSESNTEEVDRILNFSRGVMAGNPFADDVSLVEIIFENTK